MKQTAVDWLVEQYKKVGGISISMAEIAKEMEKEQSYTYDEMRTIAYTAYCLAQLEEPTEGKYNLWIQQFKKKQDK
jgi:hypothetical protein